MRKLLMTVFGFAAVSAQAGLWFKCSSYEGNWTDVDSWYTYY